MGTETNNSDYVDALREDKAGDTQGFPWDARERNPKSINAPNTRPGGSKGPKTRPLPPPIAVSDGNTILDSDTRTLGLSKIEEIRRQHGWVDKKAGDLAVDASHEEDPTSGTDS